MLIWNLSGLIRIRRALGAPQTVIVWAALAAAVFVVKMFT